MDVCVGVCILCNYASSSYSNDTPAGMVCLVMSVLFTRVLLKQSSIVLNSFRRWRFQSTDWAGSVGGWGGCTSDTIFQPSAPVARCATYKSVPVFTIKKKKRVWREKVGFVKCQTCNKSEQSKKWSYEMNIHVTGISVSLYVRWCVTHSKAEPRHFHMII